MRPLYHMPKAHVKSQSWTVILIILIACALPVWGDTQEYKILMPLVLQSPLAPPPTLQGTGSTYYTPSVKDLGFWTYDWSRNPPDYDIETVPMIWGRDDVCKPVSTSSGWLLGFNEPDVMGQANISPREGAILWRDIESCYPDHWLVSPATIYTTWLTRWWDEYTLLYGHPPRVNAVAHHCYGDWDYVNTAVLKCTALATEAVSWAKTHGIPQVWVTEFAYTGWYSYTETKAIEFMRAMTSFYHSTPEITRYAWFQARYTGSEHWAFGPDRNTSLLDYDTFLPTPLGDAYMSLLDTGSGSMVQ